jgi:hypothetical protein
MSQEALGWMSKDDCRCDILASVESGASFSSFVSSTPPISIKGIGLRDIRGCVWSETLILCVSLYRGIAMKSGMAAAVHFGGKVVVAAAGVERFYRKSNFARSIEKDLTSA